jgi:hypothetical protein
VTEPTLSQLLKVSQRTVLLVTAGLIVIAGAAVLILRDEPTTVTADGFSLQLTSGVHRAPPRNGELMRLHAGRSTLTVRPLHLPPYEGDVSGVLPVYATNHTSSQPTEEGSARINRAPGYQVTSGTSTDVFLVPSDHARDGVRITYRRASKALRLTLRSFEFRTGRD